MQAYRSQCLRLTSALCNAQPARAFEAAGAEAHTSTRPPYMISVFWHTASIGLARPRGLTAELLRSMPCRVAGEYRSSLSLPPNLYVFIACRHWALSRPWPVKSCM